MVGGTCQSSAARDMHLIEIGHRTVGADYPAGDLPGDPFQPVAAAVAHHRNFGDGGPGCGVRADPSSDLGCPPADHRR